MLSTSNEEMKTIEKRRKVSRTRLRFALGRGLNARGGRIGTFELIEKYLKQGRGGDRDGREREGEGCEGSRKKKEIRSSEMLGRSRKWRIGEIMGKEGNNFRGLGPGISQILANRPDG
jgi:hypothetical protein